MWLIVTHTFKRNEPRLAEWSKGICITLRKCFCGVLTSNWKVSTSCSPQSFITFIQTTQNFVIILYIEDIETNLPIGKHTLRVLYEILKRLFQKFVSMFNLCVCFYLLHCCICISLFYVVLIPTYFENLGHLQLERFESSKFLSKILVAKKKKGFFFATKVLVRNG